MHIVKSNIFQYGLKAAAETVIDITINPEIIEKQNVSVFLE